MSNTFRFLWVVLQIDSICAERTDEAIRDALNDLPLDLSETFRRILQKAGGPDSRYQRRILELLVAAFRPLTVEQLREALSVVPGDAVWNPARLINNVYATLACCGSLIVVDEEELTVRFAHHSIRQFLVGHIGGKVPEYQFTVEQADRQMGRIIVTYLNYGVSNTQIFRAVPKVTAQEVPSKILDSSTVKQLALGWLRSQKPFDHDIYSTLNRAAERLWQKSREDFHFHTYARELFFASYRLRRGGVTERLGPMVSSVSALD